MKKQLAFIFFLLFFLFMLPACSIFGIGESDDSMSGAEAEEYEEDEDEYVDEEDDEYVDEEDDEYVDEEDDEYVDEEDDEYSDEEDTGMAEAPTENIEYIDEEDEDFLTEDGQDIIVEDESKEDSDGAEDFPDFNEAADADNFSSDRVGDNSTDTSAGSPKKWISYKKIKNQPYNVAGFLVNAVYIVREGESINSISQKVFGSEQGVNHLYAINPHLKARTVKVGDKIYYQSPNRPQDVNQLLFYFEDRGISPQYHEIQAGENIRTIASQLLGDPNSWKEIWATNPDVDSKGELDRTITVKYWPQDGTQQDREMPQPEPEPILEPEPEPSIPEPEELLPEPEPSDPEQPPIGEKELPIDEEKKPSSNKGLKGFSQKDMIVGAVLVVFALIFGIAIMKKRKKKEFDYTATNFEIDPE